jgi:5-hydroxyisourate hydrolase
MSQITCHVLDITRGLPATSLPVTLYQWLDGHWQAMAQGTTNDDGRVDGLLPVEMILAAGNYRIHFDTDRYFKLQQQQGFYPYIDIVFTIDSSGTHYHIPLLLSAYGYSTYRGS